MAAMKYEGTSNRFSCYACGCLILTVTSLTRFLEQGAGVPGLAISLVFISLASGSVKATVAPFIGKFFWGYFTHDLPKLKKLRRPV